ncbi:cycloheximide resistance protein [Lepidopterella palustris CBS 459.81]|uniref:Cycloheximide resistance protein n=1 Tax=Lepidopterella palustris CBS 459.81 TaxID=1314670 RepID=A0A8E2JJM6_9PEZI|nr:cycloheximide resistance protein [Lepidopterella palustris CBS 459.81]
MPTLFRDAPFGQCVRLLTGNRVFRYQEEEPGFVLPENLKPQLEIESPPPEPLGDSEKGPQQHSGKTSASDDSDKNLVEWFSPQDPDNPKNWSTGKKVLAIGQICLYTFSALCGSSITAPAENIFVERYGASPQASGLVLSMYVLGTGCGPLLFSPLSEVPRIGRNLSYMVGLFLCVIITIPAALVNNYPGLVVLRFLQGFLSGPIIATSGASAGDLFAFNKITYAMCVWTIAGYGGPALGPLLSGFAVSDSWRWTMYEMLMLNGLVLVIMFFCMPETNAETILLRRAQRLRKITGNEQLQSQSEIKQGNIHLIRIIGTYLTIPFKATVQDPAIAFVNVYTALVYAIYFSFFESFPLVYIGVYGMSLGMMGVIFLVIVIASVIGAVLYTAILYYHYEPYTLKHGIGVPEHRLIPAVFAAVTLPIGLFLFGWTSRASINWAVPTLGILFYGLAAFVLLQCIVVYLPTSYPRYAASLFAANTFMRNAFAACAVHYARPLFANLGVAKGCSLLGGLSVGCFFGMLALYMYGGKLRARSKFAATY